MGRMVHFQAALDNGNNGQTLLVTRGSSHSIPLQVKQETDFEFISNNESTVFPADPANLPSRFANIPETPERYDEDLHSS